MGIKMQRILGRRVLRDLRANFLRYLALFFLIVLGMYMVLSVVGAAETVIQGVERSYEENCGEDGQFGTFVPLTQEETKQITDRGVTLEKLFSMDYRVNDATVRVMKLRSQIDLFAVTEGRQPENDGETVLEQHYAQTKGYVPGSTVEIGGRVFTVVGTGSLPDYDAPYEKAGDTSLDPEQFGYCLVGEDDYDALKREGKSFRAEEYVYGYRLNGAITDDELKELVQSFALDRTKVTDVYFLEMLDELEETKNDIQDGIDELSDGSNELADGLAELAEHNKELKDAVDSLFDALLEEANDSFADNDIAVTLEAESFEEQLDGMIADASRYSAAMRSSMTDLKETLQDLQKFRDGIYDYTEGVDAVREATFELHDGIGELASTNGKLHEGTEAIVGAVLQSVNGQLAGLGVPELTLDNYRTVLNDTLLQAVPALAAVRTQLDALKSYRDGIYEYTGYVAAAKSGSYGLWQGEGELTDASPELQEAADELLDAMLEMVQEQLEESGISVTLTRDNFETQLDRLAAAGGAIDDKLRTTLRDTLDSFRDIREFQDGIVEYTDAVQEAADGSRELADGVKELQEAADDMIEEYFTFDLDNLTSFMPKADNMRIKASCNDVIINKYSGIAAGIVVMLLFTYVISVFVIHNIEQESTVIGALYALGIKRRQLILHYLLLPVVVTFLGGIAGSILAFTPIGIAWQMADTTGYFSFPPVEAIFPPYLIVYALIMPPVTAVLVNYIFISKKLKCTALSLLRNEQRTSRIREVKLGRKMGFVRRFQIRQMLRELRSAMAVVIGMYICLIIVMLSLDCYVMCEKYRLAAINETKYEYMYSYKYPTKEAPKDAVPVYMETLNRTAYGYNLEVTLVGIEEGNPYYDMPVSDRQNEIVVGSAVAEKFQLKEGDKFILTDEINNRDYAFTVTKIVYLESSFYCFMGIDAMRELFGQEDDYYNVVFADHALDIDAGRLYSTVTRDGVMEACSVFVEMMAPMVTMLMGIAVVIFVVVMYLMSKVMIDRSAFSIALVKIFGFRRREVKKLYLNGNFFLVAVGALLCIPLAKQTMDALYPYCISNVAVGMDLHFSWQMYVGMYAGILLCYLVINPLLMRRINRMVPAEVLKNRE